MPLRVGFGEQEHDSFWEEMNKFYEVREHFASPLLQFAAKDNRKTFTLVECPSGTGQLIGALTNDKIDVAIALTDPLISGIARGSTAYKLVGSYVKTPLTWAVITGKESKYNSISDLKSTTIGISRPGSGSQVMASVMALQQGWQPSDIDWKGLVDSVNKGDTSVFMWEWFTTKPWLDRGEVRFIGSVPTPWPSWMIAASSKTSRDAIRAFLAGLSGWVREFDSQEKRSNENVDYIKTQFGYPEEDIKAWMQTVGYPSDCGVIEGRVIVQVLDTLEKAGVFQRPDAGFDVESFVEGEVARVV